MNATAQSVLFITSNSLGDAVLSTGLLAWMIEQNPDALFTVVAGPAPAPLFAMMPQIERIIPLHKKTWSRHWLNLWLKLGIKQWDLIVDLRNTAVSRVLRAKKRIIFTGSEQPIAKSAQLAQLFGVAPPPMPRLWISREMQAAARALIPEGAPILALAPAANWTGKQWPAACFAELALALTADNGLLPGARIALFATRDERRLLVPLYEKLACLAGQDRVLDFVGRTDTALAAACLAHTDLFIGNDSGLMHMAAALGIPTLGLFGPSDDRIYGPQGSKTAFIRTKESLGELMATDTPCRMLSLTVSDVEAAAVRLYKKTAFPAF